MRTPACALYALLLSASSCAPRPPGRLLPTRRASQPLPPAPLPPAPLPAPTGTLAAGACAELAPAAPLAAPVL
jgi:hypothetical protein